MNSISSFDIESKTDFQIENGHKFETVKTINGFDEVLETWIYTNETTQSGYRNYRVITDEVLDFKVRVRGEYVDQVIKREAYSTYYNPNNSRLIAICNKHNAFEIAGIFENNFNIKAKKHKFNIPEIINQSSDVRGAKFEVQIETVTGVSLKGTQINSTHYYTNMINSGKLSGVIVTYDYGDRTVTFRVSVDGTLLFYSQLSDHDYLDFIDMLYQFE